MKNLIVSLFPGIGLLDLAFEEAGYCVVRGPDLLWGGNIERFHPPAGRFDGVIGSPPCQLFSPLVNLVRARGREPRHGNLIPEFERCVAAAAPRWFLMENVPAAPVPAVPGYAVHAFILDNRWLAEAQHRQRRFSFGIAGDRAVDLRRWIRLAPLELAESSRTVTQFTVDNSPEAKGRVVEPTVCGSGGVKPGMLPDRSLRGKYIGWKTGAALRESLRLQGLPLDFLDEAPLTLAGKHRVIGNGVPLPLGRVLVGAVRQFECEGRQK